MGWSEAERVACWIGVSDAAKVDPTQLVDSFDRGLGGWCLVVGDTQVNAEPIVNVQLCWISRVGPSWGRHLCMLKCQIGQIRILQVDLD